MGKSQHYLTTVNMSKEKPAIIRWQDLPYNQFSRTLHSSMITTCNYFKVVSVAFKRNQPKQQCYVRYDKDYALEYLVKKVFLPLLNVPQEQLFELLEEAYDTAVSMEFPTND